MEICGRYSQTGNLESSDIAVQTELVWRKHASFSKRMLADFGPTIPSEETQLRSIKRCYSFLEEPAPESQCVDSAHPMKAVSHDVVPKCRDLTQEKEEVNYTALLPHYHVLVHSFSVTPTHPRLVPCRVVRPSMIHTIENRVISIYETRRMNFIRSTQHEPYSSRQTNDILATIYHEVVSEVEASEKETQKEDNRPRRPFRRLADGPTTVLGPSSTSIEYQRNFIHDPLEWDSEARWERWLGIPPEGATGGSNIVEPAELIPEINNLTLASNPVDPPPQPHSSWYISSEGNGSPDIDNQYQLPRPLSSRPPPRHRNGQTASSRRGSRNRSHCVMRFSSSLSEID